MIYKRVSKGFPEAAQDAALLAAGITPDEISGAWVDVARKVKAGEAAQPERDYMLGAAREGDELWVARPGVLATTEDDAIRFVAKLCDMGAVLWVASTKESFKLSASVAQEVAAALRLASAIREDERKGILERARKSIRVRLGRAPIPEDKLKVARALWTDDAVTAEAVSTRVGVSVRTLYRYLGPKGSPIFGKKK